MPFTETDKAKSGACLGQGRGQELRLDMLSLSVYDQVEVQEWSGGVGGWSCCHIP